MSALSILGSLLSGVGGAFGGVGWQRIATARKAMEAADSAENAFWEADARMTEYRQAGDWRSATYYVSLQGHYVGTFLASRTGNAQYIDPTGRRAERMSARMNEQAMAVGERR